MNKSRGLVSSSPALRALAVLGRAGLARSRELERAGLTRAQIRRLTSLGQLERVGRGLYRRPGAAVTRHHDLALSAYLVPRGVVCLLSALRFHGLTTQNPFEVWLAIDRKSWRPRVGHPPLRLVTMSTSYSRKDLERHLVEGVEVRVFSAAKTVADCFRYRNKLGLDVALEALRAYRAKFPGGMDDLWRCAKAGRVARVLQPYLDALA